MPASKVFFIDFRQDPMSNFLRKFEELLIKAGIENIDFEKKFTAIKVHFGEYGNVAYLRPNYARIVADIVRRNGGFPFATDCNTLYAGSRKNALEHLDCAASNGYTAQTLGCNIIIGDGLKGDDDVEIPIDGELVKNAKIGRAIADADILITVSHFKCHQLLGYGGALKNLAMGCASRRGKMEQHSAGKPAVNRDRCIGCRRCAKACASDAIVYNGKKAEILPGKCVGCGNCIPACTYDAIAVKNDDGTVDVSKKIGEYAAAAVKGKTCFHICIISDVQPHCDCRGCSELPIVPNIGILASADPVAIDRACIDLVNAQKPIPGSYADREGAEDLFDRVIPGSNWRLIIDQAVKMGIGTTEYELIRLDGE